MGILSCLAAWLLSGLTRTPAAWYNPTMENERGIPQSGQPAQHKNPRGLQETIERAAASGLLDQKVPRAARFAILESSGVPAMQARDRAGYSPTTSPTDIRASAKYAKFKAAIRDERARLAETRGYRLRDSARFYRDKSENRDARRLRRKAEAAAKAGEVDQAAAYLEASAQADVTDNAQIRAREAFDRLMGYLAPVEVEQERPTQQSPVVALLQVLTQYNVTPMQLLEAAQSEPVEPHNHSRRIATDDGTHATHDATRDYPINNATPNNYYVNHDARQLDGRDDADSDATA